MEQREDPQELVALTRDRIERRLEKILRGHSDTEVIRLARYLILGGGHRWRPMVLLAAGRIFQRDADQRLLAAACGLEIVHAATLLLDDLPSMDNARLRRGKPCAHLIFPSWAVDMASPLLVSMAYSLILDNDHIPSQCRVEAAVNLGETAVSLCEGQVLDIVQEHDSQQLQGIYDCYALKTGSLYSAAARIGGILCGATAAQVETLSRCGSWLGLAVQCFDDVADIVAGVEIAGKLPGRDSLKRTVVDALGVEGAIEEGRNLQHQALTELDRLGGDGAWLRYLVRIIPRALVPETY